MKFCKGCGAEILWVETDTGKQMPLSIASKQRRFIVKPTNYGSDKATLLDTYVSHFADCPKSKDFRKD